MPCKKCRMFNQLSSKKSLCPLCPEVGENDSPEILSETGPKRKAIDGGFVE